MQSTCFDNFDIDTTVPVKMDEKNIFRNIIISCQNVVLYRALFLYNLFELHKWCEIIIM